MAFGLKSVTFGKVRIKRFQLPKEKELRNSRVDGEHFTFWQDHESRERRELRNLSKQKHAQLALGRAAQMRASVVEYMKESISQLPELNAWNAAVEELDGHKQQPVVSAGEVHVAKVRRPAPKARHSSVDDCKRRPVLAPLRQFLQDSGEALARHGLLQDMRLASAPANGEVGLEPKSFQALEGRCASGELASWRDEDDDDDKNDADEEETEEAEAVYGSSFESTFDGCVALSLVSKVTADGGGSPRRSKIVQVNIDTEADQPTLKGAESRVTCVEHDLSTQHGKLLRRQFRFATIADPSQSASEFQRHEEFHLRPYPPSTSVVLPRPTPCIYRRLQTLPRAATH
eukprot:TRINITY_DN14111_c0_g2_i1.p1 TRINITY_DN14111_c0_g2~~TRINITY_DN14111_c0_g2_i1.p1  ORF type:complete len:345 (+),score=56.77 TRINITY_DN14111_c0_g2_i1:93-1127(+)